MWTPLSRLPLVRDRMQLDTIEGDDMEHEDRYNDNQIPAPYEVDNSLAAELEKIEDEPVIVATEAGGTRTIEMGSSVNQYRKGDRFTVDISQDPWAGLLASGVAQVVD